MLITFQFQEESGFVNLACSYIIPLTSYLLPVQCMYMYVCIATVRYCTIDILH